jgi:hypothetical protein
MCYNAQMATKKKDDKEITVVADLAVEYPGGVDRIKTFDAAWHFVMSCPTPARMVFVKWSRKN